MAVPSTKLAENREERILSLGSEIFEEVQAASISLFNPEFYTGKLINWAMEDEEFKVSLFRFVDVLPALKTSEQVVRHAQEYFKSAEHRIPGLLQWGLNISPSSVTAKIAAQFIRKQIRTMAERFILGETPKSSLKSLRKIRKEGLCFTVDLLGEETVSEVEAIAYQKRYLELLETLAAEVPGWKESSPLVEGHVGEQTPINISVKLSALYSQIKPVASEDAIQNLTLRLREVLAAAKQIGAFVYLDMEDTKLTSITIDTFKRIAMEPEFKQYDKLGIVLQAYLRRTEQDVRELISWAKQRDTPIGVRLVKGAYWDTETILAKQHGWPIPVWQEKASSDACYERITDLLLDDSQVIVPAFGSHNIRSLINAIVAAEERSIPTTRFELQALYGMAEPIKSAFSKRGFLVRDYAPIGELIPGMGYLVRRLLENTSNEGFLRLGFREGEDAETLLAAPDSAEPENSDIAYLNERPAKSFSNVPLRDFSLPEERRTLQDAIDSLQQELTEAPKSVQPIVEGERVTCEQAIPSVSPENSESALAFIQLANIELAEQAVQSLSNYFPKWRATPVKERAQVLLNAAELMEARRASLSATIIMEAGKPWLEADADVAEAIDFLRYYAYQAMGLSHALKLGDEPGEENTLLYEPRGVAVVISPWNFPLAIPCGMFSAALVAGNCAILKPAEQTSLIAHELFNLLLNAGLPKGAAAFLPGYGEEVGEFLTKHPLVSTIAFTGSKQVGLQIIKTAAEVQAGQEHIKRAITEMGGKNAIIVDENADLDEAVQGVLYSAFGFSGQKCSACSRVIILESAYEAFLERLAEATKSIKLGPATDPKSYLGPVIDDEAHSRLASVIARARETLQVAAEGEPTEAADAGYYIRPIVFRDVPTDHEVFTQELFGPVLAAVKAESFDHALEIALASEYGLTGGLFSRSPANIQRAAQEFRVGNLYLNRGCTGALVMRQPFGGAKMSGVGSKAGGPDYLQQFLIPRAISENTMRRGFAPL